jgi:hypothetical protein
MEDCKMKNQKITSLILYLLLLALMIFPSSASAAGASRDNQDEVIAGNTFTLSEGETYDGDLFVLGGTVNLETNSLLNGNILLFGGNLVVNGTIDGDIISLGGNIEINQQGTVEGDINSAGAYLEIDPEARIEGDINTEKSGSFWTQLPAGVRIPRTDVTVNPFLEMLWFVFRTILWALLAILTVMFLGRPANRVARAAISQPWLSGGVGLLTAIIAPIVLVILSLTIILIPLTFTALIVLVIAWGFGIISLGLELGRRLAKVFDQTWHPALAAGVGTFALVLVINGLDALIPCLGWIPKLIIGVLGLGSVLITFFGTRDYPIDTELQPVALPSYTDSEPHQVEDGNPHD